MIILRQKNYGLISGIGTLAGKAIGLVGTGVVKAGALAGAVPGLTGAALLGYGLHKLIKRRRERKMAEQGMSQSY